MACAPSLIIYIIYTTQPRQLQNKATQATKEDSSPPNQINTKLNAYFLIAGSSDSYTS